MSLFQACEWWKSAPGKLNKHGFASTAFCVDNIDNKKSSQCNIMVGALDGNLRIYSPNQRDFRIEDLIVEKELRLPILQIECGLFLSNSTEKAIAILHPLSLAVYRLVPEGDVGSETKYFELTLEYEHKLDQSSHSFVYGPFGSVYEKDYLCVQSMDGMLSFFEQDTSTFKCSLNNFLVPGPLEYIVKSDSFVTVNAEMCVQSYTYQMLATSCSTESRDDQYFDNSSTNKCGEKELQVDWLTSIGEHCVSLLIARFSPGLTASQSDIVVVGDHTLFTLKTQGNIRSQKRLDFSPSCATSYRRKNTDMSGGKDSIIIGTHQKTLMIFHETALIWATQTQDVPIAIHVACFGGVQGLLVLMFANGSIQICYLGTDPMTTSSNFDDSKHLDYESLDHEHKQLLKTIRNAQNDTLAEPNDSIKLSGKVGVSFDSTQPSYSESVPSDASTDRNGLARSIACEILPDNMSDKCIKSLQISTFCCTGFIASRKSITLESIAPKSRADSVQFKFYVSQTYLPSSLDVHFIASFLNDEKEPRTARLTLKLPFVVMGALIAPEREAHVAIMLETNRPALDSMRDIFGEEISAGEQYESNISRSNNVMSVRYFATGSTCTILMSKKSGRYRLQASNFASIFPLLAVLNERLTRFWRVTSEEGSVQAKEQKDKGDLCLSYAGPIPWSDYWCIIDHHLQIRLSIEQRKSVLENLSRQMRVIQKRLLAKYKEKTPSSVQQFDVLFRSTFKKLKLSALEMKELQNNLKKAASELSTATSLLCLLVELMSGMDEKSACILRATLTSTVEGSNLPGHGWQERVNAAMTYLLSTKLAKNTREANASIQCVNSVPLDSTKLKKHIKLVCHRISKGQTLQEKPSSKKKKSSVALLKHNL